MRHQLDNTNLDGCKIKIVGPPRVNDGTKQDGRCKKSRPLKLNGEAYLRHKENRDIKERLQKKKL